ncbi:MAG: spore coat protein [Clostridia bacterium]|nr:spore coat protein [Clostridia bacterium]
METKQPVAFDEEQRMTDLLSTQKFLTGAYNSYYCEAATGAVKNCLSSILQDEHRIQEEVFNEMNNRGWYPLEQAEEAKINSAKQKFAGAASK